MCMEEIMNYQDNPFPSTEIRGLYQLAAENSDMRELVAQALTMLTRSASLLSEKEKVQLGYFHKRLNGADNL